MSDESTRRGRRERDGLAGRRRTNAWSLALLLGAASALPLRAQSAEPELPRPGAILVLDVYGEATATASDQQKSLKPEERLRVGSTIATARMSLATIILSNGTTLRLGSEAELEIEEFGQATIPGSVKYVELKAEPTVSRTRLRLLRGDVTVEVKPLNASRGSSFMLTMLAGTVRTTEGTFHARVRMSDLGLGICTIEVTGGAAEFEPVGGKFAPIPPGSPLAFAVELDRVTGAVKVSDMPRADPSQGKKAQP